MNSFHFGLIGTGYMGKTHAIALHAAPKSAASFRR